MSSFYKLTVQNQIIDPMQRSLDQSVDYHSDTESIISSEFDQLNYAMIYDDPHSPIVSPSRTKTFKKKLQIQDFSSDQQDWKTKYTCTIYNGSPPPKRKPEQIEKIKQKYPPQRANVKCATITVRKKDNTKSKYENLCAICLDEFSKIRGILKCGHKFCFQCIEQWSKASTNCPCCRDEFKEVVKVTMDTEKKIEKGRQIVKVESKKMEFNELDYFVCYECNRGDDEDVLLICDMCDFYCCHVYCDHTLADIFPENDWFCKFCKESIQLSLTERPNTRATTRTQTQRNNTQITRTATLNKSPRRFVEDQIDDIHSDSEDEFNFFSGKKTRPSHKTNLEMRQTRSKAYQIINYSTRNTRNRRPQGAQRAANSTAVNLRNLRRRRI